MMDYDHDATELANDMVRTLTRQRDEARETILVHTDSIAYLKGELDKARTEVERLRCVNEGLRVHLVDSDALRWALADRDKRLGNMAAAAEFAGADLQVMGDKLSALSATPPAVEPTKPCPFCGGPAERNGNDVACANGDCALDLWFTPEKWNTRAHGDALEARYDQLSVSLNMAIKRALSFERVVEAAVNLETLWRVHGVGLGPAELGLKKALDGVRAAAAKEIKP